MKFINLLKKHIFLLIGIFLYSIVFNNFALALRVKCLMLRCDFFIKNLYILNLKMWMLEMQSIKLMPSDCYRKTIW